MKIFFLRLLFILTVLSLEFSFFDVLFPWVSAPLIIIVSVVVWSLLIPFPRVFFTTVSLTLLFDIVSSGKPDIFTLYAVILVYATSFFSRRLLVEQRGIGMTLYACFATLSVLGFSIFEFIFSRGNPFFWTKDIFVLFFPTIFSQNLFLSMLLCLPLFFLAYSGISRFERYVRYVAQGEILKMK